MNNDLITSSCHWCDNAWLSFFYHYQKNLKVKQFGSGDWWNVLGRGRGGETKPGKTLWKEGASDPCLRYSKIISLYCNVNSYVLIQTPVWYNTSQSKPKQSKDRAVLEFPRAPHTSLWITATFSCQSFIKSHWQDVAMLPSVSDDACLSFSR